MLVSPESTFSTHVCRMFEADIYLLYHTHQISKGFETTVHVGNVCQICKVEFIKDKVCIPYFYRNSFSPKGKFHFIFTKYIV